MIPLVHDFSGTTVLVFGGGTVGARKSRRFAREASVVVVSPTFADEDFGDVEFVRAVADPDDVGEWIDRFEPVLVVAATDDPVCNEAIADAATERSVLVNRADRSGDRAFGSVVVPATVREDPVVVSISTGGHAPALSKYLRTQFEDSLAGAGEMAELLTTLRKTLEERGVPPERRHQLLSDVVRSKNVWTGLRTGASNETQVIEDVLSTSVPTEDDSR